MQLAPWSAVALLLLAGCSGFAPGTSSASGFEVLSFDVVPGQVVGLNHPLEVTFSGDVDFSTVAPDTLRIARIQARAFGTHGKKGGEPAVGTYSLVAPNVVRFTPTCPSDQDEAGLRAGSRYTVFVPGDGAPGLVIRSTAGVPVREGKGTQFRTPAPGSANLYEDEKSGAPEVVVRDVGSSEKAATYLELGLNPNTRVYFERDGSGNVDLPLGFLAPLNLDSVVDTRVAWLVQFDQPIDFSPQNLAPERVRLEGLAAGGAWTALATRTQLVVNCGKVGAVLRVTPVGVLPQDSQVRLVLDVGFRDLSGEARTTPAYAALAPIATAFDPGTTTPGDTGDQRFEAFAFGGDGPESLEDTSFDDGRPQAIWGNGKLIAEWNFDGTGGPNGDFDWYLPAGTDLILSTLQDTIVGGPNGVPSTTEDVIGGVVDIRDLYIPASSRLILIGPNPLTLLATGSVRIEGQVIARGTSNPGVLTLNTTNVPEPGAPGQASGGDGGVGSYKTTQSTPRGGPGFGPFQVPAGGGQGGETSYSDQGKANRRGAGGGGGRFATDVRYDHDADGLDWVRCQSLVGMDVERGAMGGPGGLGAESQSVRAQGGVVGPTPFQDANAGNDFFGTLQLAGGAGLVHGELDVLAGGAGGGAGGDAVNSDSFPLIPWSNTGDEKGAGGGGGGGAIHVLALGPITIFDGGSIGVEGGTGGGGENTNFFDRVGGGSGGGSGGAIVLESLTSIEVQGTAENGGPGYRDNPALATHSPRPLSAVGGQGGAGNNSAGGSNENGPTGWSCDRIPFDHFEGIADVPPQSKPCFLAHPDINDPDGGPVVGAGGDGGPGLIQLHVPDLAALSFPDAAGDVSLVCAPPPIGWDLQTGTATGWLLPTFGQTSVARSRWIPLGLARHDPSGVDDQVLLFFGGTTAAGDVMTSGGQVVLEAPLIGPDPIQSPPHTPFIDPTNPYRMVFDAAGVAGFADVVERNPSLMQGYTVRLSLVSDPSVRADFVVALGVYDAPRDRLVVTVAADGDALTDFSPGGQVQAELLPRSFQAWTGDVADALDANVRITFDATRQDGLGRPDDAASFSAANGGFAGDVSQLNAAAWDFVRFQVEFTAAGSLTTPEPRPALTHLRVPYRF